jgi:chemotaxis protein histidine kinase CheA
MGKIAFGISTIALLACSVGLCGALAQSQSTVKTLLDDVAADDLNLDLGHSAASKTLSKAAWHRHRPHIHHRHRPHVHVPHLHVPHVHTAAMIKAAKDAKDRAAAAAAKKAKDLKDAAAKAAKDARDAAAKKAKDLKDAAAKAAKDAKDAAAKKAKDLKDAAAKAAREAAAAAAKKAKDIKDAAKAAFSAGLKKAKDAALNVIKKKIIPALIKEASWSPKQYRDFTLRVAKDFTGSLLDNNDDYTAFHKHADPVLQRVTKYAFGHMANQTMCKMAERKSHWLEHHPTPFSDIAKLPHSPFSVYPFKAQYENDPQGYFAEPCNAVSNGFFLTLFGLSELTSTSGCAQASSGFAMDCIDEKHLLQVSVVAPAFGSWYMHGDGGSSLGGRLDNLGMDIEFYYIYRLLIKNFVHDNTLRAKLVFPYCTKAVPNQSEGINWVNSHGEKMCHLYWARNFKKAMVNEKILKSPDNATPLNQLMAGVPPKELSIAGMVLVSLRAVFHKKFPEGDQIYTKLTSKIIDVLMAKESEETKNNLKTFRDALDANKILGLENPHDGVGAVIDIFADFMDAMFWQESGQFGPATKGLVQQSSKTDGCTTQPHSMWHRKATRVIGNFIKMAVSLKSKLKHPKDMVEFKLCGIKPCGLWVEIARDVDKIVAGLVKIFNMKRLNAQELRKDKGGKDIVGLPELFQTIKSRFGTGWPKTGRFVGETWPKCPSKASNASFKQAAAAKPTKSTKAPVKSTKAPVKSTKAASLSTHNMKEISDGIAAAKALQKTVKKRLAAELAEAKKSPAIAKAKAKSIAADKAVVKALGKEIAKEVKEAAAAKKQSSPTVTRPAANKSARLTPSQVKAAKMHAKRAQQEAKAAASAAVQAKKAASEAVKIAASLGQ